MARNSDVSPHIGKLSKSKVYSKKAVYKRKHAGTAAGAPKKVDTPAATKSVKVGGKANGGTRTVPTSRAPAFYPAEDVLLAKKSRKSIKPVKLRESITPGTVLILLAGRFRGKRVVFLKQLASGLLLITGPYKINGVPLRRVNQAYVIATSTKVDISGLAVDAKVNDAYFTKDATSSRNGTEAEFFKAGEKAEKKAFPESKAADQKKVDKAVLEAVAKTANLNKYLAASFGLSKSQLPHLLKF